MENHLVNQQQKFSVPSLVDSQYLAKLSAKLEPEIMAVVKVKYQSPRIGNLEDGVLLQRSAELLRRIHVVTGWDLPSDQEYVKILIEEFMNKLKADYPHVNYDEILYAFRKHGIGVKDWGKKMNLDLICFVLGAYLHEREEISRIEERAAAMPSQRIYSKEELLNIQRYDIECFYQRCRNGRIPPENSIPEYFLKILVTDGFLPESTKLEELPLFFSYALGNDWECLYQKSEN